MNLCEKHREIQRDYFADIALANAVRASKTKAIDDEFRLKIVAIKTQNEASLDALIQECETLNGPRVTSTCPNCDLIHGDLDVA